MRNFFASSTAVILLATTAISDNRAPVFLDKKYDVEVNINASEMIGMHIYASETGIKNNQTNTSNDEMEWNDLGEINEVLLSRDGRVQAIIVGVTTEKNVAIPMSELHFIAEANGSDQFFIVIEATTTGVQNAPSYDYRRTSSTLVEGDGVDEKILSLGSISVDEMQDDVMLSGEDANPNPVVPQNALIPPALIPPVPQDSRSD